MRKSLAHDLFGARHLAKAAARAEAATRVGTQIHAGENYRRVLELVRSGAIGPVREVHVWCGKSWSRGERPTDTPPVPKALQRDFWPGPAAERTYNPTYPAIGEEVPAGLVEQGVVSIHGGRPFRNA